MRIASCCVSVLLSAAAAFGQEDVAALTKSLRDDNPATRLAAAEKLAGLGPKAAKASVQLAKSLADKVPAVADAAGRALAKIGKHAFPSIRAGLKEQESLRAAVHAIETLGANGAEFMPDILGAFKQFDGNVDLLPAARKAVKAIGAPAVPFLRDGLKVRVYSTRAAELLHALGPLAEPALAELIALLADKSELAMPRNQAAAAIGVIGKAARKHAPVLLEVALKESEDASIREAALSAIGWIGSDEPHVAEGIKALLTAKEERLVATAKRVLEQLKRSKP